MGPLNPSVLCCVSRFQWCDSECDAAGLTLSHLQEGHYSHLAHGPEAAVTSGRKELSVSGKSTVQFYTAIQSLCFILYPGENSVSGVIQKSHFPWEKTFFFPFHVATAVVLPAKMK